MIITKKIFLIVILVINIDQVFTQGEYYIAKCRLNIRAKPSVNGMKIGEFKRGDSIDVIFIPKSRTKVKWYKVKYKNNEAYVYSHFVKEIVLEEAPPVPPRPIKALKLTIPVTICRFAPNGPVYPGCETFGTISSKRKCFKFKIIRFFEKKFKFKNIKGLKRGSYNVATTFTINQKGRVVNIKPETKYKTLQKEITRVLDSLPQMMLPDSNESIRLNYEIEIAVVKKSAVRSFLSSLFRNQNKRYIDIEGFVRKF